MLRKSLIILLSGVLAGCADFPDLDHVVSDQAHQARFPSLDPFGNIFASADQAQSRDAAAQAKSLARQATALRQRGRKLRAPVISASERRRLATAIQNNLR